MSNQTATRPIILLSKIFLCHARTILPCKAVLSRIRKSNMKLSALFVSSIKAADTKAR